MFKNHLLTISVSLFLTLFYGVRMDIVRYSSIYHYDRSPSPVFSVSMNSGNSFDKIQIFGSSDLISEGAYLLFTALDNGEQITAPVLRIKERKANPGAIEKNKDSIVNLYSVLPIFYEKPWDDRRVTLELITYGSNKKWPIEITVPLEQNKKKDKNRTFMLKGLKPAVVGTFDKLYHNFNIISKAHTTLYGFTTAELRSKQPSEWPDYVRPLLLSNHLLDSVLNKEQFINMFGFNQEGSEDWNIFEAILSQIGLVKLVDDIALSLKNDSYLKDEFHVEPLIKRRGGPNVNDFFLYTTSKSGSVLPEFYPPKTPEDLDKCMKLARQTQAFEKRQHDDDLKAIEALIKIGTAAPHPASLGFKASEFFIKLHKVRNKLLNSMLPSEISTIEGELFQNEFHEEGPELTGIYRNIKITATNEGLSAEDISGIIDIIDPLSSLSGAMLAKPLAYVGKDLKDDLFKYMFNIYGDVLNMEVVRVTKEGVHYRDSLTGHNVKNKLHEISKNTADMVIRLFPHAYDRGSFGPFDITDKKWIDVKSVNENVVKVNEFSKSFEMVGYIDECGVNPWLSFRIRSGKFPRSRQKNYDDIRNDHYSLVLPIKCHPISINAQLPEATALFTMAGRCSNKIYRMEVNPGETKTFIVEVTSAVDDRISGIAERGMVSIDHHANASFGKLETMTSYTISYTAPEDDEGFVDAIHVYSLSDEGLRGKPNAQERSIMIVVNVKEAEDLFSCSENMIHQLSLMRMVDDNPNHNAVVSICYDKFIKKTHVFPTDVAIGYANKDSTTINLAFYPRPPYTANDYLGVDVSGFTIDRIGFYVDGFMKVDGKIKAGKYTSNPTIMLLSEENIQYKEIKREGRGWTLYHNSITKFWPKHVNGSGSITISKWSSPCYLIGYFSGNIDGFYYSGAFKIKLPATVYSKNTMGYSEMNCIPNILGK